MAQIAVQDEILNRKEAAEMLKVPQRTLDYLVSFLGLGDDQLGSPAAA